MLPFLVTKDALANYYEEDLSSSFPENIPLNPAAGHIKIMAIGGPIFVKFGDVVDKTPATHGISTLTMEDNPTEGDSVTLDEQDYIFKALITKAARANLVLDGDITPGEHAQSVLTLDGDIEAGDTVTIGTKVYTFVASPAVDGDVALGVDDETSLSNLKDVINVGNLETLPNAQVFSNASDATTLTITARTPGTSANSIALDATGDLAWDDTTMGTENAGVDGDEVTVNDVTYTFVDALTESITNGPEVINQVLWVTSNAVALDNLKKAINGSATEGTDYSTGTEQPTGVTATTNTDTEQLVEASATGAAGNSIAVATTGADLEWQDEASAQTDTLADGYDDDGMTVVIGNAATDTQANLRNAVNGGSGSGTTHSAALTAHETLWMGTWSSDDSAVTARVVGTDGNGIVTDSDFTSGNNSFSDTETAGGDNQGSFDDIVPAGEMHEYGIDEDIDMISFIAAGASTDIVFIEY